MYQLSKLWQAIPVWFIGENPVAGYTARKSGVMLMFWNGQHFDEPELEASGSFHMAQIAYHDAAEIDEVKLAGWLQKAGVSIWDMVGERNAAVAARRKAGKPKAKKAKKKPRTAVKAKKAARPRKTAKPAKALQDSAFFANAEYQQRILVRVATELQSEFGKGYSLTNVKIIRQFYRTFPLFLIPRTIGHPLGDQFPVTMATVVASDWRPGSFNPNLSWRHYRALVRIDDATARAFYELECVKNNWSGRELERQTASLLYERLARSRDK